MSELSLNVLDITQNSVKAGAGLIEISVSINADVMIIEIIDDGCGMSDEQLKAAVDPFYTTRTTRSVGLGISFFKQAAEMTGGRFCITSEVGIGTRVKAEFVLGHIDRLPLGDMNATVETLILCNPDINFVYRYRVCETEFTLSTSAIREIMEDIPLNAPEVTNFIKDFLRENTNNCNKLLKGLHI